MSLITDEIEAFASALPRDRALFGLDLGTKTLGVAASDLRRTVASPIETIRRTKFTADANALLALVEERDAAGLVLGLPRNMDGSEGPRAQSTRAFARNLSREMALPIVLWDESTHVPFIIVAPGVTTPGSRSDEVVSTHSIYPTLVELAGLERPGSVDGTSVAGTVRIAGPGRK